MIQNVSSNTASAAVLNAAAANGAAKNQNTAAPQEKTVTKKAVPSVSGLNAQAFLQRQQIGAALYDRSFTLKEGARALKRQDAIQAYAEQIQAKEGGPTAKDLRILQRKLDRAAAQIDAFANNDKGINLSSVAGIDGRDIDIVQANLAARINQGIKDGSLTDEEAKGLITQQQEIADIEVKLRESDGKLTAGEQKQILDQFRKTADAINQARNNGLGTNLGTYDYADSVDTRQAALEKQLEQGIKLGSLTADEADVVRAEFAKVNALEETALVNGNVNWREAVGLSSAMNTAEIALYDLQRNNAGVKLADSYVDVKYVDMRQAQQLESVTRGIDRGTVTNEEGVTLLNDMQSIETLENRLESGGLTRGEYLRLQTEMNDFSLLNADLQGNRDRYTGIFPKAPAPVAPAASAPAPVAPAPAGSTSGNAAAVPGTPVAPVPQAAGNAAVTNEATRPVKVEAKPETVAEVEVKAKEVEAETRPAIPQVNREFEETRDLFGEMMTKLMRDRTDDLRKSHDTFLEKADEHRREASRSHGKSGDHGKAGEGGGNAFGLGVRDADREFKIASYAAVAGSTSRAEPVIAKKVA